MTTEITMSIANDHNIDEQLEPPEDSRGGFVMIPPFGAATPPTRLSRHTVSADAILSAEEVIQLLGGRSAATRRWLRQVAPLPHPSGRRVYLWGDVIATLKAVA